MTDSKRILLWKKGQLSQKIKKNSTRRAISTADSIRSSGAVYSSICCPKVSSSSSGTGEAFKSMETIIQHPNARNSLAGITSSLSASFAL